MPVSSKKSRFASVDPVTAISLPSIIFIEVADSSASTCTYLTDAFAGLSAASTPFSVAEAKC